MYTQLHGISSRTIAYIRIATYNTIAAQLQEPGSNNYN